MASYRAKPPMGARPSRRSSLGNGLVAGWLLNEKAGLKAYDATGKSAAGTLTNGPVWGTGPHGSALGFTTASSQYVATNYKQTSPLAAAAALVRSTAVVSSHVINVDYNGSTVGIDLSLGGEAGTTQNGFGFYAASNWRKSGVTTDIRGDGLWHLAGGDYDGSTLRYVLDGKVDSTFSFTGSMPTTSANRMDIGRYLAGGLYITAQIGLVLIWNRPLSILEWKTLAADPFHLFRRRWVPVPIRPAGAAPSAPTYPQLERGIRGVNRGVAIGSYR